MNIKYLGHSCFRIEHDGYKVIFDPYKNGSVPGYGALGEEGRCNLVLCSHEHDDHYGLDDVIIEPFDGECPFEVQKVDSYHDPEHGALRGKDIIHVLTAKDGGVKLVHYGDLGQDFDELLTAENKTLLSDADYAFVPVGGVYTLDADQAIELIDRTSPKLAIAMHYRNDVHKCDYPHIASDEDFIAKCNETGHKVAVVESTEIDSCNPGEEIIVMTPACCK